MLVEEMGRRGEKRAFLMAAGGEQCFTAVLHDGRRSVEAQLLAEEYPGVWTAVSEQVVRAAKLEAWAAVHYDSASERAKFLDQYAPRGDSYLAVSNA